MPILPVDPSDPRLELYRGVADADLLRSHNLFVAEGRLVVERVLEARYQVESALMNDASVAALGPAFEAVAPDVPVFHCRNAAFEAITGFNIHRGCLALVRRPAPLQWREAIGTSRLVVVLEAVTNADNVGGVFRNAAAFGAGSVLLSPTCCDPLYRKSVRTSMGAVLTVPFARVDPWPDGLSDLREQGFVVAALSPRAPLTVAAFADATAGQRVALVVGTEGVGLSDAALAIVDTRIGIPIHGSVDSLNLAVATGIALARCAEAAPADRQD
jgi:tRNA G18 (ribose-2'-O)-methylase SpoU